MKDLQTIRIENWNRARDYCVREKRPMNLTQQDLDLAMRRPYVEHSLPVLDEDEILGYTKVNELSLLDDDPFGSSFYLSTAIDEHGGYMAIIQQNEGGVIVGIFREEGEDQELVEIV